MKHTFSHELDDMPEAAYMAEGGLELLDLRINLLDHLPVRAGVVASDPEDLAR